MNTKNDRNQNNQRQKTRRDQGSKKQGQRPDMLHDNLKYHEQERIETRMTR
jgi:hypothetical protein